MIKDKLKTTKQLIAIVASAKRKGQKVVFTNGCFDILHPGHISYLEQAALLGEKLVVAVNSDSSVRKIKGRKRPIFKQGERAILVAACESVDYVVIFHQPTPLNLIKSLKPAVLVKGGDWRPQDIEGKDVVEAYGGRVVCLGFIPGCSSTSIINKIQNKK